VVACREPASGDDRLNTQPWPPLTGRNDYKTKMRQAAVEPSRTPPTEWFCHEARQSLGPLCSVASYP